MIKARARATQICVQAETGLAAIFSTVRMLAERPER